MFNPISPQRLIAARFFESINIGQGRFFAASEQGFFDRRYNVGQCVDFAPGLMLILYLQLYKQYIAVGYP